MSSSNVQIRNITVDDFDPTFGNYSNYADWYTPDPSINPTWYNASRDVTNSPWHEATYHTTTVVGAKLTTSFTSSSFYIYGAAGPNASNSNFTIIIDGNSQQPFNQSFKAVNNSDNSRILLYGTDQLRWDKHQVEIINTGSGLTLDLIVKGGVVGASGTSVRNTTIDDAGGQVRFSGNWTTQQGPNFSNGTSTYTQGGNGNNSFAFDFNGQAVYLYGDQVNDHGYYEVYVDQGDRPWTTGGTPNGTYNDRSGCGGGWIKACEKLKGLKYSASDLSQGQHTMAVRNLGFGSYDGPGTFFDFDYVLVTQPDQYATIPIQSGSCPFVNCGNTTSTTSSGGTGQGTSVTVTTGPSAAATSSRAAGHSNFDGLSSGTIGWGLLGAWMLRKFLM